MAIDTDSDKIAAGQHDWTAFALLVMTTLCWSGNTVLVRYLHESIAPAGISFWRTVFVVLVLIPFIYKGLKVQLPVLLAHWRLIFGIGIAQFAVGQVGLYQGLQTTTAINAGLMLGAQPALAAILAWLTIRERLSPVQWLGVVVAMTGVSAIVLRGEIAALTNLQFVVGDIWVGVAVIGWAIYAPFVRRLPPQLSPFVVVAACTFTGGIGLLPLYLGEVFVFGIVTEPTWETLAIVGYISVFGTVLGVVGWNVGITRIGAGRASTFLYLIPVFTVVLGVGALGEAFRIYHVVGMALVLAGVAITNRAGARAAA